MSRAAYLAGIAVELHQTEASIRESEQRFSTAFHSGPVPMAIIGFEDRRFRYVNDRFLELWGRSRAEVVGRTSLEAGFWRDASDCDALWRALEQHGRVHDFEMKGRGKNGDIDVLLWAERIQILGEPCLLAIAWDITERTRAETALAQSERLLRTLTGRLMRTQDDERRRIAQMLHETTAQDLAALKMQLASLTRSEPGMSDHARAIVRESIDLAERSITSVRTLSYLLHPPFLDENGLVSALRWYAEGSRSGAASRSIWICRRRSPDCRQTWRRRCSVSCRRHSSTFIGTRRASPRRFACMSAARN